MEDDQWIKKMKYDVTQSLLGCTRHYFSKGCPIGYLNACLAIKWLAVTR